MAPTREHDNSPGSGGTDGPPPPKPEDSDRLLTRGDLWLGDSSDDGPGEGPLGISYDRKLRIGPFVPGTGDDDNAEP